MASNNMGMMIRSFSTSNVSNALVKAPIQIFGINGRYATALYSAANKNKSLESVERELVKFQATIKTDTRLREFIADPTIKRSIKAAALKGVSAKASLGSESSNFLQLLAENGRLKNLNNMINCFKTIMSAHRGEVICEVITAKALDGPQKQKLESVLKSFIKKSETVSLTAKVDPNILGGMIISIDDKYVDMSVSNKIKKLTDVITLPA